MSLTRQTVLKALAEVVDADGGDIVAAGIVRALNVEDGTVRFVIEVDPARAEVYEPVRAAAEAAVKAIPGVKNVLAVLTAHRNVSGAGAGNGAAPRPAPGKPAGPEKIPGIDRILAIASGKGGVGKSTLAASLACALAIAGRRVGLLDADVYGPSQPRMLGVSGRPASPDGKTILPLRNHGVTMMSLGLMVNEDQAVVWRGPMLMGALQQMLYQVQWGKLDVLIVDLPPGTGDAQMTLAQKAQLDGAIIVSTPQDVALLDARKGIDMFDSLQVPILGMIENMSTHICSKCGHEEHLFGHGGVAKEAAKLNVPLLAQIPLHIDLRRAADGGAPVVVSQPESVQAQVFHDMAQVLLAKDLA